MNQKYHCCIPADRSGSSPRIRMPINQDSPKILSKFDASTSSVPVLGHTMCPPVLSWFMIPSDFSSSCHEKSRSWPSQFNQRPTSWEQNSLVRQATRTIRAVSTCIRCLDADGPWRKPWRRWNERFWGIQWGYMGDTVDQGDIIWLWLMWVISYSSPGMKLNPSRSSEMLLGALEIGRSGGKPAPRVPCFHRPSEMGRNLQMEMNTNCISIPSFILHPSLFFHLFTPNTNQI